MSFQKQSRLHLNGIFYHMNKYNIFGGLLAYFVAANLNAVASDSNKFMKSGFKKHYISILLIIICFVTIKEFVKLFDGKVDRCECKPVEKSFVQELEECGNNNGITDILKNVSEVIFKHGWDFTYKYNLLGLIFVLLLGSVTGTVIRTNKLFNLYPMTMIILSLVIMKYFFKVFLETQNFCQCHCKSGVCAGTLDAKKIKNELVKSVKNKGTKNSLSGQLEKNLKKKLGSNYDYYKGLASDLNLIDSSLNDETEKLFQKQYDLEKLKNKDLLDRVINLDKLKPGDSKLLSDALVDEKIKELCGKNKPFKILETSIKPQKCMAIIDKNKVLKSFVVDLLKDIPTYTCIRGSNSSTAINSCISDYVLKQPKMAEKLVNDYLEIQLKDLEDIIDKKYSQYKSKEKPRTTEDLEKEIARLTKLVKKKSIAKN